MTDKVSLADRMKGYEKLETLKYFDKSLPIVARLDGRGFSKFTSKMNKPFDKDFSDIMKEVTKYLVEKSNALIGYTQSDEITLVYFSEGDIFFSGKVQKLISTLAAMATAKFLFLAMKVWSENCENKLPTFDCRMFNLPSNEEVANCVLFRTRDAIRNSISAAARSVIKGKGIETKNSSEKLILMKENGVDWEEYPKIWKEGSFFKRVLYKKDEVIRSRIDEVLIDKYYIDLDMKEKVELIFEKEESKIE